MPKMRNGKGNVSRRKFLKTAGMAGGAVAVGFLAKRAAGERAAVKTQSLGPGRVAVTLNVNGRQRVLKLEPRITLVQALREHLHLTGTKQGCGEGDCGACVVLLDGVAVNSCLVLAAEAEGRQVTTIEGVASGAALHPVQQAFLEVGAVQCGFCTPGMVLVAKSLLDRNPSPTRADVRAAISGNLCRCSGYQQIVDAIREVKK
jgi:carbon-monoxide dehydrogenase small subunit